MSYPHNPSAWVAPDVHGTRVDGEPLTDGPCRRPPTDERPRPVRSAAVIRRPRLLAVLVVAGAVAGAAACSTSGGQAAERTTTSGPTTTTEAPDCVPARRPAIGGRAQEIDVAGSPRTYLLDVPPADDGTTARPLVFDVHGFLSNAVEQDARTRMAAEGNARGYVVVTPEALGTPSNWRLFGEPDPQDDYAYLRAVRASVQERLCIDPERIYAAGHSAGSAFSGFAVCREPYGWAAVAMVSAAVPSTCPAGHRPSALAIAGTRDAAVPYDGGTVAGSTQQIGGFLATFEAYVDQYGCTGTVATSRPAPGIERRTVDDCDLGAHVQFDTVVGGTHAWPGTSAAKADLVASPEAKAWDATAAILDFFDANPLRR
jgi:polyhydroxybutyrate depolymerase